MTWLTSVSPDLLRCRQMLSQYLLSPKSRLPGPQPHHLPRRATFSKFLFHDRTSPTAPPFLPAPLHPTPSALSKNTLWGCPSHLGGSSRDRQPPPYGSALEHLPAHEWALGLGRAWHRGWGQGTLQSLPLGPAVSFLAPVTVMDAGRGWAEGLPQSAIGRQGGSRQGARPRRVELSQKCSSGRALSGLDKRGTLPSGGKGWARWQRAGQESRRHLGGGLRNEGVSWSLQPSS